MNERSGARRSRVQIEEIILQQLAQASAPMSAYDIAKQAEHAGTPVVANQVYRTLARMMERGQIHRLEALSAYIVAPGPGDALAVCERCHAVAMLSSPEAVDRLACCATAFGFTPARAVLELYGRCVRCMGELQPG
jgi:Fur family zinc uptake transcriptional regulator